MAKPEETPDFLEFVWIWNHLQGQPTPAPHRRIARWLQGRWEAGDHRLLLMAFRGCGKSTMVGLFCAWRLLREPDTRILVLAADQALAVKMVAQVRRILERHPLCAARRSRLSAVINGLAQAPCSCSYFVLFASPSQHGRYSAT